MADNSMNPPAAASKRAHRAYSLYLATVAGIPIYLHFTFLLIFGLILATGINGGGGVGGALFFLLIFASVALHELGHAMMARNFGIRTEDIVLYPIGGVARLRSMGEGMQEFWIAIAGPAVNVVIAAALWGYLRLTGQLMPIASLHMLEQGGLIQSLMMANLLLVVFNMIPAFPMDGGRVLRAILAQSVGKERATSIASRIGQILATGFMIWGLLFGGGMFLLIIGLFVFMAAGQENAATKSQVLITGRKVRDAMIVHFDVLEHGESLGRAADLLLATSQQDFPVMHGTQVVGLLSRKRLLQGLAQHGRDYYVAQVMDREFPRLGPQDDLQRAFEAVREHDGMPVLVFDAERLIGFINNENLMEYLMIAQLRPAHA